MAQSTMFTFGPVATERVPFAAFCNKFANGEGIFGKAFQLITPPSEPPPPVDTPVHVDALGIAARAYELALSLLGAMEYRIDERAEALCTMYAKGVLLAVCHNCTNAAKQCSASFRAYNVPNFSDTLLFDPVTTEFITKLVPSLDKGVRLYPVPVFTRPAAVGLPFEFNTKLENSGMPLGLRAVIQEYEQIFPRWGEITNLLRKSYKLEGSLPVRKGVNTTGTPCPYQLGRRGNYTIFHDTIPFETAAPSLFLVPEARPEFLQKVGFIVGPRNRRVYLFGLREARCTTQPINGEDEVQALREYLSYLVQKGEGNALSRAYKKVDLKFEPT